MINGLKDRMLNISSSAKKIILASASVALLLIVSLCTVCICAKSISIVDADGSAKELITFKRYVGEVLDEEGVVLGTRDKLNLSKDTKIKDGTKIEIYRAFLISVTEKGETRQLVATRRTAGEALQELGYNPKKTDKITPGYDKEISEFDEVIIVRVDKKTVTVEEEIPYEAKDRENKAMASGTKKLVQKGVPGEKTVSYKVCYEDGVEVSREKVSETVKVEPIAQIREVGPKNTSNFVLASAGTVKTSRSGSLSYSKVLSMNATAYDASSCGKSPSHPGYGITATGRRATYGVVAVDPRVIPLGSRLYIESADGRYVYGTAIAADTGGAIKGNRIDLCYDTRAEAISFGRRAVKVYVLN
jgi:uncharacterized protein YabE (DUF348 family)